SGGGSSGGGGGDSGDSSSTPACVDDTDVVGYRKCKRFGAWAAPTRLPHLFIELGSAMRRAPSQLGGQAGDAAHDGESFAFRTVARPEGEAAGHDLAMGLSVRLGVGLSKLLYSAVELEIGGLVAPAAV